VHGLAFASILAGLGLDGSMSVLTLLAFNVGVELAQLVTVALVFPSLYLASRTRCYPALRIAGASAWSARQPDSPDRRRSYRPAGLGGRGARGCGRLLLATRSQK